MGERLITNQSGLRTRRHGLTLGIGIILFLILNIGALEDGQKWYSDGFQYMIHAKNLPAGEDYAAGIILKRHFAIFGQNDMLEKYPVGFPLMLAPIICLTGMNLWWAKIPGVVFWAAWCLVAYSLFRRRFGNTTACLGTLFLLFSPYFFIYKQEVRPDVPFLFFLTCAVSSYEAWMDEPSGHRVRLVAFLLFTMASFLIRPVAVILFIAAIIHLVFFRRRFGYAAVTAAALLSAIAVESLLGASSGNYLHIYLSKGVWEILNRLQAQFIYVFEQIIIFFFAGRPLSFPILWLPLLMMCAVGIFEDGEQGKTIDLLGIFTLLYLIVILLFPAKQGPRYIFPLVAPVLIYVLRTLGYVAGHWKERGLAKTVINAFLILGLIYNVCATVHRRDYTDDQALQPEAREMTQWVKNNVSPTEHYLCWDPRAMAFLTGRIGMGLPAGAEEVARLCRSENLRWVMLIEGLQDKLISELKQAAGFVDAWHNERYRIFKYCPDQDADPIYSRE